MRKIRLQIELTEKAVALDRRYWISLGDGFNGSAFTLANPDDQFSDTKWQFILGEPHLSGSWSSITSEGMYVHISRQYVNPNFDFSQEEYQRQSWLIGNPEVSSFRLYNPLFARPCLNWDINNRWSDGQPFSEGDQFQYAWSFADWETKIEEREVQYYVKRLDDSDNYKEFLIRLD